jgi:hypothetical protein
VEIVEDGDGVLKCAFGLCIINASWFCLHALIFVLVSIWEVKLLASQVLFASMFPPWPMV